MWLHGVAARHAKMKFKRPSNPPPVSARSSRHFGGRSLVGPYRGKIMELMDLITHFASFIFGGAVGGLITLKVTLKKIKQSNIRIGKGDVVGGDKRG